MTMPVADSVTDAGVDAAAPELAVPDRAAGSAIIETCGAVPPGAAGGQDRVMDVTAARWPPCAAALDVPLCAWIASFNCVPTL